MSRFHDFRNRLFLVLMLVALIPSALTLLAGTFVLREVVVSTGSAGPWDEVARSGQGLLDAIAEQDDPTPQLMGSAERHREQLEESVRLSRLYAFLGERVIGLLPYFALGLLLLVSAVALLAANWISRALSRPVEELVAWTLTLGSGARLPPHDPEGEGRQIREFVMLKAALRRTEERLEQARRREAERIRMQSWAEMARKVAHELKNPLTPMRMAAERVAGSTDPGIATAGTVLTEEIGRLDSLARSFSQFGRPPEGPKARVDLVELLETLARRLSTDGIPIVVRAPDRPVEVMGHLEALERVARNLLANAQEATEEVAEGERPSEPVEVLVDPLETAVEIRFLDRGPGMSEKVLASIWQPEFTTKRRGTGLGLPLVQQAVRAHGGEVGAFNREGGGAEFRVRLPYDPDPTSDRQGSSGGGSRVAAGADHR